MSILPFQDWLETPQGRYLLDWEQAQVDRVVADIFGYNAVQLGLPGIDLLRANRMPCRLRCALEAGEVRANAFELPFASGSLDLVVLPHVLEFSAHPHRVLREVERVLVPEGSVAISGFNPFSLWGMRRLAARAGGALPWQGQYRSAMRIRDWFHPARLRGAGQWFRLLCAAREQPAVARALAFHGPCGRTLVARVRGHLSAPRCQARAGHAPDHTALA